METHFCAELDKETSELIVIPHLPSTLVTWEKLIRCSYMGNKVGEAGWDQFREELDVSKIGLDWYSSETSLLVFFMWMQSDLYCRKANGSKKGMDFRRDPGVERQFKHSVIDKSETKCPE